MVCEPFQREQPRARFLSIGFDLKLEVTGSFTCCADKARNQAIDLPTLANMPVTSFYGIAKPQLMEYKL